MRNLVLFGRCVAAALLISAVSAPAANAAPEPQTATQQQNLKVQGTVVDENGDPMVGVSIRVEGHSTGTNTNIDGEFSLNAPAGSNLRVTYIGYAP